MNMLVSVIVPVYNVERYLADCVESILQQTYSDFELILVDDGSPDNCGKICDEFSKKDPRIKVIHQQNCGLSAARNNGINVAKGDFFTFIDSDDFVFPHYLERLVELCERNGADISVCSSIRCSSKDSLKNVSEKSTKNCIEVFERDKMNVFFTTKKINTTAWGKLYKRFIFDEIRYPVNKYNEDVFVTYKAIHIANKVACCDYQGYVYRINEMSIINESFSLKKLDSIEGCLERAQFIERNYPDMKKYAYRGVIYSCNQVLLSMAKSNVYSIDVLNNLQKIYRNYWMYYVFNKSVFLGKIYAIASCFSVKFVFSLTYLFFCW